MKERPILFKGEMVRAILDGRKTQTRRIASPAKCKDTSIELAPCELAGEVNSGKDFRYFKYGKPGDKLWVREKWGVVSHAMDENDQMADWVPDRPATQVKEIPFGKGYYSGHVIYAADGYFEWSDDDSAFDTKSCWKPSIHMPRQASRITLEITNVRVERLQEISEEDAKAEGCGTPLDSRYYKDGFRVLWESINGLESWNDNPLVWVIEFKRLGDLCDTTHCNQ